MFSYVEMYICYDVDFVFMQASAELQCEREKSAHQLADVRMQCASDVGLQHSKLEYSADTVDVQAVSSFVTFYTTSHNRNKTPVLFMIL